MKKIKLFVFSFALALVFSTIPLSSASAACESRFLTFPSWWRNLPINPSDCSIEFEKNTIDKNLSIIIANVVEIILQLVGYTCVAFIITGGFYYMTSTGSPENAARGLKTIRNAAIGLVLSLMSVGIVNLVASGLGK